MIAHFIRENFHWLLLLLYIYKILNINFWHFSSVYIIVVSIFFQHFKYRKLNHYIGIGIIDY